MEICGAKEHGERLGGGGAMETFQKIKENKTQLLSSSTQ